MANDSNKNVILAIIISSIISIGGTSLCWYYFYTQKMRQSTEISEGRAIELEGVYKQYDAVSQELQEKIIQIKRLGGNIDSLLIIQKQLEREKSQLFAANNKTKEEYENLKRKLEAYQNLLVKKDEEIQKLQGMVAYYMDENDSLKKDKTVLKDQIQDLKVEKEELNQIKKQASALRLKDMMFVSLGKSEKEKEAKSFKARQLEKLKITYIIDDNKVANKGLRNVFVRIINPDGDVLSGNSSNKLSTFEFQGQQIFYTLADELMFDNMQRPEDVVYDIATELKKGQYRVEMYCDGFKIGINDFVIN